MPQVVAWHATNFGGMADFLVACQNFFGGRPQSTLPSMMFLLIKCPLFSITFVSNSCLLPKTLTWALKQAIFYLNMYVLA